MAIPSHQQALLLTQKGLTNFTVEERHAVPTPAKGELLVRVKVTALNPADYKMADSGFLIQSYPVVLGCDLAGIVAAVDPSVTDFQVGDEIWAHTKPGSHRQGSFQQFAIVEARMASHKPKNISFASASTLGVGTLTAADGLFLQAKLPWPALASTHRHLLVWGGAASVGSCAVQLANIAGYEVIATASPKNFDLVRSFGAKHVVDYNSRNAVEEIRKISNGKLTFAFDAIGADTASLATAALSKDEPAHILTISGAPKTIPANVTHHAISIIPDDSTDFPPMVKKLHFLVAEGKLKPQQHEVLPHGLRGIEAGLERLKKGVSGVKLVAEL